MTSTFYIGYAVDTYNTQDAISKHYMHYVEMMKHSVHTNGDRCPLKVPVKNAFSLHLSVIDSYCVQFESGMSASYVPQTWYYPRQLTKSLKCV